MGARWLDFVDPTRQELTAVLPAGVDPDVLEVLLAPPHEKTRPLIEGHGSYVLAVLLEAAPVLDEGRIGYREVDLVATRDLVLAVRKSPPGGHTWDQPLLEASAEPRHSAGELVFRVVDDVAESFIDAVDLVDAQIHDVEDHVEEWPSDRVRQRLGALRYDLLAARRAVGATRAVVRRIMDEGLDIGDDRLFPPDVERRFASTYETLLRASEELDFARDLLASSRDYHQSVIAERQNDIVKTLTVIASLVLVPTLITGFYGQNFESAFDDTYWSLGTSVALIAATTVLQLALYRWRRWI